MFYAISIPENSYPGQKQLVNVAALNNYFVTTIDASDDLVYRMTKAIFGNLKELRAAHSAASGMNAESALAVRPIEVHPGAMRYFREAGLLR
jgi:TRAP transporter TAXI family solute receptor